jgi:hypothetical protein
VSHSRPPARGPKGTTFTLLADVISEKRAMQLCAAYGGRRLYIPATPPESSKIVKVIGLNAAAALGRRFGGVSLDVPLELGTAARVLHLRSKGWSVSKIAAKLNRTERYVRLVANRGLAAPALVGRTAEALQAELFVFDDLPTSA